MSAYLRLMYPARRDAIFLLVAALLLGLFVLRAATVDALGFPLDDAWIHQTYARNLADYGEWAFIPSQASAASTSPLYTILLAIGHLFKLSPFFWAHLLGILALAWGGMMAARIAERLFPTLRGVGILTGLMIMATWHVIWAAASGMETMLFMALSLTLIWLAFQEIEAIEAPAKLSKKQIKRAKVAPQNPDKLHKLHLMRGLTIGIIGGLLTLARPEGFGLLGLVGLFALGTFGLQERRRYLIWGAAIIIGWLIVITPYTAWNYNTTGELLPTTASAKAAEVAPLREQSIIKRYVDMLIPLSAGGQTLALAGVGIGLVLLGRRAQENRREWLYFLPLAWALAHLTLFVVRLPAFYQHGRYVIPILPPLLLYAGGGLLHLLTARRKTALGRVVSRTLALSALAAFVAFLPLGASAYANDVRIINTEMVETAKWIRDNIPTDGLFVVHDIGALGYYAPREILDLAGLVSPEIIPIITDYPAQMALICERGARWMMVWPDQRPTHADDPRLTILYESPYDFADQARADPVERWKMRVYAVSC